MNLTHRWLATVSKIPNVYSVKSTKSNYVDELVGL